MKFKNKNRFILFPISLSIIFSCCYNPPSKITIIETGLKPVYTEVIPAPKTEIAPNPTLMDKEGVSLSINFDSYTISIKNRRTDYDVRVKVYIVQNWDGFPIYEKKVSKGKSCESERIKLRPGEHFRIAVYIGKSSYPDIYYPSASATLTVP